MKTAQSFAVWYALKHEPEFFSTRVHHYGGANRDADQDKQVDDFCRQHNIRKKFGFYDSNDILAAIRVIGIDWEDSKILNSSSVRKFMGTFAEPEVSDVCVGKLVLVNRQAIDFYAHCRIDGNLFDAMQEFFSSDI